MIPACLKEISVSFTYARRVAAEKISVKLLDLARIFRWKWVSQLRKVGSIVCVLRIDFRIELQIRPVLRFCAMSLIDI